MNFDALTIREKEVAELIAEGYLNKEIAERLAITERTVKGHRAAIYQKLRVRTTAPSAEAKCCVALRAKFTTELLMPYGFALRV
jgi:DNA-binding NarL/FixJ family response regulator